MLFWKKKSANYCIDSTLWNTCMFQHVQREMFSMGHQKHIWFYLKQMNVYLETIDSICCCTYKSNSEMKCPLSGDKSIMHLYLHVPTLNLTLNLTNSINKRRHEVKKNAFAQATVPFNFASTSFRAHWLSVVTRFTGIKSECFASLLSKFTTTDMAYIWSWFYDTTAKCISLHMFVHIL